MKDINYQMPVSEMVGKFSSDSKHYIQRRPGKVKRCTCTIPDWKHKPTAFQLEAQQRIRQVNQLAHHILKEDPELREQYLALFLRARLTNQTTAGRLCDFVRHVLYQSLLNGTTPPIS